MADPKDLKQRENQYSEEEMEYYEKNWDFELPDTWSTLHVAEELEGKTKDEVDQVLRDKEREFREVSQRNLQQYAQDLMDAGNLSERAYREYQNDEAELLHRQLQQLDKFKKDLYEIMDFGDSDSTSSNDKDCSSSAPDNKDCSSSAPDNKNKESSSDNKPSNSDIKKNNNSNLNPDKQTPTEYVQELSETQPMDPFDPFDC